MSDWERYRAEVENIALVVLSKELGRFTETQDHTIERAQHHRSANSKEWRNTMDQCLEVLAGIRVLGMGIDPTPDPESPQPFMVRRINSDGVIESRMDFKERRRVRIESAGAASDGDR